MRTLKSICFVMIAISWFTDGFKHFPRVLWVCCVLSCDLCWVFSVFSCFFSTTKQRRSHHNWRACMVHMRDSLWAPGFLVARGDCASRPHGSYLIKHTPLRLRETAVSPNTFRQTESRLNEETKEHIPKPNKETSDSCDPLEGSLPVSSVLGILQARILKWVVISFPRGSSQPRNRTWVTCQILYQLSY